jgi:hypothetical protein
MYCDRRVAAELLALLQPGRALSWLLPTLRAEEGWHVQTRRQASGPASGSLQVYCGRTSPLSLSLRQGRLRLEAHPTYAALAPALFAETFDEGGLAARGDDLRAYLQAITCTADRIFLDGEARLHAGLMRRYGLLAPADAPFLALDAELKIGFVNKAAQRAATQAVTDQIHLPAREEVPTKLDALGVDRAGRLLLIEVKHDPSGLDRAGWQAAAHRARFAALEAHQPDWVRTTLASLAGDKARVGLLGEGWAPPWTHPTVWVPVLAAADPQPDWARRWSAALAPVIRACKGALQGLELWRLGPEGQRLEVFTPAQG